MGRRNTKISTMIPKDVNTMHDTQVPQTNYFIRVTSTTDILSARYSDNISGILFDIF